MSPCHRGPLALALSLALGLASGLGGCTSREADNPFDPENPDTHGNPPLLDAVAGDGEVRVSWEATAFSDLAGVRLLRRRGTDPEVTLYQTSGEGSRLILDREVTNGTRWSYRLELTPLRGEPVYTASDVATPGSAEPWVGDALGGLVRLSPDGRDLVLRIDPGGSVLDLEVGFDGSVWAADYGLGALLHFDNQGQPLEARNLYGATAVAFDRRSGLLWAGSFLDQSVVLFSRNGLEQRRFDSVGPVEDVAAAPDSGVFVAARVTGVSRYTGRGLLWRRSEYSRAVAVVPRVDGFCWVVDRVGRTVTLIGPEGNQEIRFASEDPAGACSDGLVGCWVADPARRGVLHLNAMGSEDYFLQLGAAESAVWDPVGRRLWVALPGEGRVAVADSIDLDRPERAPSITSIRLGGRPGRVAGYWGRS